MSGPIVEIPVGAQIMPPAFSGNPKTGTGQAVVCILFDSSNEAILFFESIKQAIIDGQASNQS